ncbi:MAG: serine/threonine-protein kinase [Kofleriaceae bacterium]
MAGTSESGRARRSSADLGKRQAGRYVLGDLLGRGGMAEVFAGSSLGDHGFSKPVAIKRLLPELANDKVFVDRLIQEAKLLVGMTHGNVVSVIDLARDGEDVFLVMDFVDGPSLRQLLKARGSKPLPLGISSYIVQSACSGLEFAHARPGGAIIHADISPSNLLLTTSGEVRVADFGIARREGGGWGVVEGKWAYMAPEQARGEPLTPRSDVFALGVVLYELITGAHPFGRQVTAEERESGQMRVIPPRIVKPSVPHGLDAICMRALAHDPRERYASMQKLADAIMDERFTNQWRDSASDLAKLIGEAGPAALGIGTAVPAPTNGPRTMVTDRPVTLFTRSLIDVTPAGGRRSAPRVSDRQSQNKVPDRASQSQMSSSAASASASRSSSSHVDNASRSSASHVENPSASAVAPEHEPASASRSASASVIVEQSPGDNRSSSAQGQAAVMAKLLEMPNLFNPNGAGMPQWQLHQNQAAPPQELASVHGGTAVSAHGGQTGVGAGEVRSNKWAISVMALAAILGVVAAIVMQTRPKNEQPQTEAVVARGSDQEIAPTKKTPPPDESTKPVDLTPQKIPGDPNQPLDLSNPQTQAPITQATATPPTQTPNTQTATPPTAPPTTPLKTPPGPTITQTTETIPTTTPGELPKLTDPSTTAPDAESLARKEAEAKEAAAKEAEKKKNAARVQTPRLGTRRDRDPSEEDDPPRRAKLSEDVGFLRVGAYPSGWVSINGGPKKAAPTRIELAPGKYKVKIFTDFESKVRTVTIDAGQVKIINVDWGQNEIQEN